VRTEACDEVAARKASLGLPRRGRVQAKQGFSSALHLSEAILPLRNQGADYSWRGTMWAVIDRECLKVGNPLSR